MNSLNFGRHNFLILRWPGLAWADIWTNIRFSPIAAHMQPLNMHLHAHTWVCTRLIAVCPMTIYPYTTAHPHKQEHIPLAARFIWGRTHRSAPNKSLAYSAQRTMYNNVTPPWRDRHWLFLLVRSEIFNCTSLHIHLPMILNYGTVFLQQTSIDYLLGSWDEMLNWSKRTDPRSASTQLGLPKRTSRKWLERLYPRLAE